MSKKSAQRQMTPEEEVAQFRAEQRSERVAVVKRVGVIVLCVALVFAFCFPAVWTLIPS